MSFASALVWALCAVAEHSRGILCTSLSLWTRMERWLGRYVCSISHCGASKLLFFSMCDTMIRLRRVS